jgi:hypothetical protein
VVPALSEQPPATTAASDTATATPIDQEILDINALDLVPRPLGYCV